MRTGPHRQELVVRRNNLAGKPRFLRIKGVLPIEHGIQDDTAAPDVCHLQQLNSFSPEPGVFRLGLISASGPTRVFYGHMQKVACGQPMEGMEMAMQVQASAGRY